MSGAGHETHTIQTTATVALQKQRAAEREHFKARADEARRREWSGVESSERRKRGSRAVRSRRRQSPSARAT
jgi:hypothetical protein